MKTVLFWAEDFAWMVACGDALIQHVSTYIYRVDRCPKVMPWNNHRLNCILYTSCTQICIFVEGRHETIWETTCPAGSSTTVHQFAEVKQRNNPLHVLLVMFFSEIGEGKQISKPFFLAVKTWFLFDCSLNRSIKQCVLFFIGVLGLMFWMCAWSEKHQGLFFGPFCMIFMRIFDLDFSRHSDI
jgi:hypothetical protein